MNRRTFAVIWSCIFAVACGDAIEPEGADPRRRLSGALSVEQEQGGLPPGHQPSGPAQQAASASDQSYQDDPTPGQLGAGPRPRTVPQPPMRVTIQEGLGGLGQELIPSQAKDIRRQFFEDVVWLDNLSVGCLEISAGMRNIELELPIHPGDTGGTFGNFHAAQMTLHLDEARFEADLYLDVRHNGTLLCDLAGAFSNFVAALTTGQLNPMGVLFRERTYIRLEGLSGTLDTTLALSGVGELGIASLNDYDLALGQVDLSQTNFVAVLTWIGSRVYALDTGCARGCSDDLMTCCVNAVLNNEAKPAIRSELAAVLDDVVRISTAIDPVTISTEISLTIAATPMALETSLRTNSASVLQEASVTGNVAPHPCAANLRRAASYDLREPPEVFADLSFDVPHWFVRDIFYEAGLQGIFCQTIELDDLGVLVSRPKGAISAGRAPGVENQLLIRVPIDFQVLGPVRGDISAVAELYIEIYFNETTEQVAFRVVRTEVTTLSSSLVDAVTGQPVPFGGFSPLQLAVLSLGLTVALADVPATPPISGFEGLRYRGKELGLAYARTEINDTYSAIGFDVVLRDRLPEEEDNGMPTVGVDQPEEPEDAPVLPPSTVNQDLSGWINPLP